MTGHGAKFGRKQEEAIAALLSHRSIEDAAQAINVAPRTLLRWLQVPATARGGSALLPVNPSRECNKPQVLLQSLS